MDFLRVKGGKVVDAGGKEVKLRGTCVGGWMNMENFINGYPGTESGLRRAMSESLGAENSRYFFHRLLDVFLAEDDIAFIKSTGATAVRLSLNYRHFEDDDKPFVYKEEGFRRFTATLDLCEKHGLYVIIDMHAVPGFQNAHWHSDNENAVSLFWKHKLFQDRLRALWQEFAARYHDRAVIAGFELMNEPCTNTPAGDLPFMFGAHYKPDFAAMNRVYRDLTAAIREIDKEHIVFVEGDRYGQLFSGLTADFDDNVVYSSHNYTIAGFGPGAYPGKYRKVRTDETAEANDWWDAASQKATFNTCEGAVFAKKHNVPLWVGEFGAQYNTSAADLPYRVAAMNDQLAAFNDFGAHWTTWTYKDMGVMGWVTVHPESEYAKIVAPIQKAKADLSAENFTGWTSVSPGKAANRALAETIAKIAAIPGVDTESYVSGLMLYTLTGFAAACLQPGYAALFKGMSKGSIDRVLDSFAFKNCVQNEAYTAVLRQRLAD